MRNGKQLPRRLIRELLMSPDIHRVTKFKVKQHRGKSLPRWKGLPKPRGKNLVPALSIETEQCLRKMGEAAQRHERQRVLDKRRAVLEYLASRG